MIHWTAGIENVTHHQKDIASREDIQKKETILSMRKEEIIQKIMIDTQKMSIRRFLQDIETGRLYIYFHFSYNSKKKQYLNHDKNMLQFQFIPPFLEAQL